MALARVQLHARFRFLPFCVWMNGILFVTRGTHDTSLYYRTLVSRLVVAILCRCFCQVMCEAFGVMLVYHIYIHSLRRVRVPP